jgi:hypothetical protein
MAPPKPLRKPHAVGSGLNDGLCADILALLGSERPSVGRLAAEILAGVLLRLHRPPHSLFLWVAALSMQAQP